MKTELGCLFVGSLISRLATSRDLSQVSDVSWQRLPEMKANRLLSSSQISFIFTFSPATVINPSAIEENNKGVQR